MLASGAPAPGTPYSHMLGQAISRPTYLWFAWNSHFGSTYRGMVLCHLVAFLPHGFGCSGTLLRADDYASVLFSSVHRVWSQNRESRTDLSEDALNRPGAPGSRFRPGPDADPVPARCGPTTGQLQPARRTLNVIDSCHLPRVFSHSTSRSSRPVCRPKSAAGCGTEPWFEISAKSQ